MFRLLNQGQQRQASCRDIRCAQLGRLVLFVCPAWKLALALTLPQRFHLYVCLGLVCSCVLSRFISVWPLATLWTVAHHAPLSMGFSRQGYWSGLPFSRGSSWPRDWTCVSYVSLHWQMGSLPLVPPGKYTGWYSQKFLGEFLTLEWQGGFPGGGGSDLNLEQKDRVCFNPSLSRSLVWLFVAPGNWRWVN